MARPNTLDYDSNASNMVNRWQIQPPVLLLKSGGFFLLECRRQDNSGSNYRGHGQIIAPAISTHSAFDN